jgi:hypothetical protein
MRFAGAGSAGVGARLQDECIMRNEYQTQCHIVLSVFDTSEILRRAHDSAPLQATCGLKIVSYIVTYYQGKKRFV